MKGSEVGAGRFAASLSFLGGLLAVEALWRPDDAHAWYWQALAVLLLVPGGMAIYLPYLYIKERMEARGHPNADRRATVVWGTCLGVYALTVIAL